MSTQISFDAPERRLNDENIVKPKSIQTGSEKLRPESIPKNESNPTEAQGSASRGLEDNLTQSLNRKVDYHIQQESNEVVVKIRDGETGEIIRQIPEEEFLRLTNRISDFNENILDEIV